VSRFSGAFSRQRLVAQFRAIEQRINAQPEKFPGVERWKQPVGPYLIVGPAAK
jgi:hypothetical protein